MPLKPPLPVLLPFVLLAAAARGEDPPHAGADPALAPLEFLIGKWREEPVAGGAEGAAPSHLEMAWDLRGRVIRRSEIRTEDGKAWRVVGWIARHPEDGTLELREHADWGDLARGTIEVLEEGVVRRTVEVSRPDGSSASRRTTLRSTGADSYRAVTETLLDGSWTRQREVEARRLDAFPWELSAVGRPAGFGADDEAMAGFEPHLGVWGPSPDDAEAPRYRAVLEWGIPGKTVVSSEYHDVDGELVQANQALIGYHYGRQRIEFLEFVRDGLRPFEVMNQGFYELADDGSLVRRYRSFDPDMSSREYRETYRLEGDGSRVNTIEYRDDDGAWQPWPQGPFRTVPYEDLAGGARETAR